MLAWRGGHPKGKERERQTDTKKTNTFFMWPQTKLI